MNKPRVLDAVGVIGRFVSDYWDSCVHYGEISEELFDRGFSDGEIEDAYIWIEQSTLGPKGAFKDQGNRETFATQQSIRRLGPLEDAKLDSKAHGALISYFNKGLIDSVLLEEVLSRVMQSASSIVGKKELRRLTALTLFNRFQVEWKELLQHSNMLLH